MPLKTRKFKDDELVVCFESFSSHEGGCSAGERLRGDNPKVRRWPQFFLPADTPDDQLSAARDAFYEASGSPPPMRQ